MENNRSVLIVTKPGRKLDGLQALLKVMPRVEIVGRADDYQAALAMVTKHCPDLVLLVTNLPGDGAWQILEGLRDEPRSRRLVLTDTLEQQRRAEALGADDVLLSGFTGAKLFEAVSRLLSS